MIQRPVIQEGAWQPPLSPKSAEIVNDRHKFLLVSGSKFSGKTFGILEKIAVHLYEVTGANVGVFFKRAEVARQGVWKTLTEFILPRWQNETGCLQYVQKPTVLNDTKRRVFSVLNHKGAVNHFTIMTAYRESEIEDILKNTVFSFIYICEADQFGEPIFDASADQLRMEHMGVQPWQHHIVMDCNPPVEGDKHWLYRRFMVQPEKNSAIWRRDYHVIHATIKDNPWADPLKVESFIQRYESNPRLNARYLQGIWVPSSEGSLFENIFHEDKHVVGQVRHGYPVSDWKILMPPPKTMELIASWDPGDVNHACTIFSKRLFEGFHHYDVLDNIVIVDRPISIRGYTEMVMRRMDFWESVLKRRGAPQVHWRHWSDPSAFTHKSTAQSGTQAMEIFGASKGRIRLHPVSKGPGSVDARVGLATRYLSDNRITISVLARETIDSFIGIRQVGKKIGPDRLKHPFDAFTYGLIAEAMGDLAEEAENAAFKEGVVRSPSSAQVVI